MHMNNLLCYQKQQNNSFISHHQINYKNFRFYKIEYKNCLLCKLHVCTKNSLFYLHISTYFVIRKHKNFRIFKGLIWLHMKFQLFQKDKLLLHLIKMKASLIIMSLKETLHMLIINSCSSKIKIIAQFKYSSIVKI